MIKKLLLITAMFTATSVWADKMLICEQKEGRKDKVVREYSLPLKTGIGTYKYFEDPDYNQEFYVLGIKKVGSETDPFLSHYHVIWADGDESNFVIYWKDLLFSVVDSSFQFFPCRYSNAS